MRLNYYQAQTCDWTRGSYTATLSFPRCHLEEDANSPSLFWGHTSVKVLCLTVIESLGINDGCSSKFWQNIHLQEFRQREDKARRKEPPDLPCPLVLSLTLAGSLSPGKDFSHTFSLEKLLTEKVPSPSSVNAISVLSSHGEGGRAEGTHLIPHSPHETQLHCISQQIFCTGRKQELDYTSWFLNKLSFASAGVSGLTP